MEKKEYAGCVEKELDELLKVSEQAENVEKEGTHTVVCGSFLTIYCC